MEVLAVIQARMASSRFPGKVLSKILGRPMLDWQIERLRHSKKITRFVLATSESPSDDAVETFSRDRKLVCFRGSEEDVLSRFYGATLKGLNENERESAVLIRLTGDCPLIDPTMIDEGLERFESLRRSGCRYLGYSDQLPDGMDFEIFTWGALKETQDCAVDSFEREHVTPFMWRNPKRFGVERFFKEGIAPGLRFSVDYPEDRDLVEALLLKEKEINEFMDAEKISKILLQDPKLRALNSKIIKNEGLIKSSLTTEKFKAKYQGTLLVRYGVALLGNEKPSEDFLGWCFQMGIQAWYGESLEIAANIEARLIQKKLDFVVWSSQKPKPASWPIFSDEGKPDWEAKLISLDENTETQGILLKAQDTQGLAAKLMLLCQTRFTR